MQIQELGYGVYGWSRIKRYAGRMETISLEATRRLEALKFWNKHGLEAALDCYKVSRRTLFNWKRQYRESGGKTGGLASGSRAPHQRRKRQWPAAVLNRLRALRQHYPSLGAEKLHCFLTDWCEGISLVLQSALSCV